MYHLSKRVEIAGSHRLELDYDSPCQNLHGHNWIITVEVEGEVLDQNDMLIDFSRIKDVIKVMDHENLNDVLPGNPTAEKIAKWVHGAVQSVIISAWLGSEVPPGPPKVTRVSVQESEGNIVWFTP